MHRIPAPARVNRKAGIRAEGESAIITAAEQVFATYGYRGASTSMIAEQAGVSKAMIYHYFETKELLYQIVLERTHNWWGEAAELLDRFSEPVEALTAYIHRKMDMSRENYYGSKVWASEVMQGAPILQGYLETEVREWTKKQIERIRSWVRAGKIEPVEPFYLLLMIWATTQHYADFEHQIATLNGGRPLDDEQHRAAKDTVTRIILKGIGASIKSRRSKPRANPTRDPE